MTTKKPTNNKRKLKLDVDAPKGLPLTADDLENVKGGLLYTFGPSGVGETSSTCCHCDVCGP